jgi:hypothetical protein
VKNVLLVTTVVGDEERLREDLRGVLDDEDASVRVLAPAADVSWLDWLTNDEDEARGQARHAAEGAVRAAGEEASAVEIDRAPPDTDAAQAVADALRDFDADEIVVVTRPGQEASWLEEEALEAALKTVGLPVRHIELPQSD